MKAYKAVWKNAEGARWSVLHSKRFYDEIAHYKPVEYFDGQVTKAPVDQDPLFAFATIEQAKKFLANEFTIKDIPSSLLDAGEIELWECEGVRVYSKSRSPLDWHLFSPPDGTIFFSQLRLTEKIETVYSADNDISHP